MKGWVSIQGAFLGSPVADYIVENSLTGPALGAKLWEAIGGSRESLLSLTTSKAQARWSQGGGATKDLLNALPSIAFSSAGPSASSGVSHQILTEFGQWLSSYGPNDGLMPVDRASLPGMVIVKTTGIDHADPVMRDPLIPASRDVFDRVRMTKALLSVLLDRMPRADR